MNTRHKIFAVLDDSVSEFLYYDRKECEELPMGAIDQAVKDGLITIDEMVARFRSGLESGLRG